MDIRSAGRGLKVQLGEWNEVLLSWFFARRSFGRAYLRVDDGELDRLNADRALGLEHPAQDLVMAVREGVRGMPSLKWLRRQGDSWRLRMAPDDAPPWLALLALSVLVVGARSEPPGNRWFPPGNRKARLRLVARLTGTARAPAAAPEPERVLGEARSAGGSRTGRGF